MMQRYMLWQRLYALWKFQQGKNIPVDDWNQVQLEYSQLCWYIGSLNQIRRRKHGKTEKHS